MGYNQPMNMIKRAVNMPPLILNNRFYVMRHGQSQANKKGLIVSEAKHGVDDYGLTHKGVTQVTEVAVSSRLKRDTIIVSSDFKRARETAEIMHSVLAVTSPIVIHQGLRERGFGRWELQDSAYYHQVWENDASPELEIKNQQYGIESIQSVLDRGLGVIKELDEPGLDKTFLLVGHGDVLQILTTYFRQRDIHQHRQMRELKNADIRLL